MSVIVSSVKIGIDEKQDTAIEKARKILGVNISEIKNAHIVKMSLDARKGTFNFVYSVAFDLLINEEKLCEKRNNSNIRYKQKTALSFEKTRNLKTSPVVVGFGPAGMFCALILARCGCNPIVVERGDCVENRVKAVERFWQNRVLDTKTNVQFGEGGAGTFSDGKLTTRISDPRCDYVLETFHQFGAPEEILYKTKPHIGTDNLRTIVKNIRQEIERLGGKVMFLTKAEDIIIQNGAVKGVKTNKGLIESENVVLAIGHSARDTFEMLFNKGVLMESKTFSVGVRIEHLQENINRALYNEKHSHPALPKGEYQLSHIENGRGVYTFCMCPGGQVVAAASEDESVVVNGMSQFARDGENANSAIVVNVDSKDFGENPLDAIAFQRKLERKAFEMGGKNHCAPAQSVGLFLDGKQGLDIKTVKPTYPLGVTGADFEKLFPKQVTDNLKIGLRAFEKKMKGFADNNAILTGVETRTSSPVRILRNDTLSAVGITGLYPCAEGAGYAGGIMSAAVDGIRVAQAILKEE